MNSHLKLLKQCKTSWIYPIYVPSYNRAGSAPLLEILSKATPSVQRRVYVMVRREEAEAYRQAYPWARVVSHRGPYGVGPARAAILRNAELHDYERIVMMDDDVVHLSLMEMTVSPEGKKHTRRWSEKLAQQLSLIHI